MKDKGRWVYGFLISEISQSVYPLLQENSRGKVFSVHKNVINLLINNQIISIQTNLLPRTPLALKIENSNINFFNLNIKAEDHVFLHQDSLVINQFVFMITHSEKWDSYLNDPVFDVSSIDKNKLNVLYKALKLFGKNEGLGELGTYYLSHMRDDKTLNSLSQEANSILKRMSDSFVIGNVKESANCGTALLGMGIGLTPSGDDFIIGLLSVLQLFKPKNKTIIAFHNALKTSIINSSHKTTTISKGFLISACRGEFGEVFHKFYQAFSSEDDEQIFLKSIDFMKIGHSSGTDSLAGIAYGLVILPIAIGSSTNYKLLNEAIE